MTAKRFTLIDDYTIQYDGDYFDLHKPSDIRSLVTVIGYVLNELHKEREYWKQQAEIRFERIRELEEMME